MDEIGSITKGLIWKGVWTKRETVRNTDDIVKTVCGKTKVSILYVLDKDKKKKNATNLFHQSGKQGSI